MLTHYTSKHFPEALKALHSVKWSTLRFTRHALLQAQSKGFLLPCSITFSGRHIVEAELHGTQVHKLVIRLPYDCKSDICLVVRSDNNIPVIVTAWLNNADDNHTTLDESRYK